jgi:hypothetical protein
MHDRTLKQTHRALIDPSVQHNHSPRVRAVQLIQTIELQCEPSRTNAASEIMNDITNLPKNIDTQNDVVLYCLQLEEYCRELYNLDPNHSYAVPPAQQVLKLSSAISQ